MNSANDVINLTNTLKNQGIPLSDAVWQSAMACIGHPYVYGAWKFDKCTPAKRKSRNGGSTTPSEKHPTIITACQVLTGKKDSCIGCKWFPREECVWIYDCRGFTHDMLALYDIDLYGQGCTSQWNHADNWLATGEIKDIPDDVLVCLFQRSSKDKRTMSHTGFGYKGETLECQVGVEYYKKRNAKWTHWAIPKGIDGNVPEIRPTLKKGSKGEWVVLAQNDLMKLGFALPKYGADGSFGAETETAVKQMQQANNLVVDGIIGKKSWEVLKTAEEPKPEPVTTLYTVTVPHLTLYQAEGLVNSYAGAYMTEERG